MRRIAPVIVIAVALGLLGFAAPPAEAQGLQKAPVQFPSLTKAQVGELKANPDVKPKLRFIARARIPSTWHGPDLVVEELGIPASSFPQQAQCSGYSWYPGLLYTWKVKNAGEQPTIGATGFQLTCEVAPASLPAATKAAWDQRLCGCMRKTFPPPKVPAIPAGKTYGDPPGPPSTLFSYISLPQVFPCEQPLPHAKVTARVIPRPEEGPASDNNTLVVEFCN